MITPSDSPSSPADYASVQVSGADIQAPQADLAGVFDAANSVAGAGVIYPQGPRQQQTEALISSPQGFGEFDITAGYSGGGGEDWPANVEP
jgi:hypothetical protein